MQKLCCWPLTVASSLEHRIDYRKIAPLILSQTIITTKGSNRKWVPFTKIILKSRTQQRNSIVVKMPEICHPERDKVEPNCFPTKRKTPNWIHVVSITSFFKYDLPHIAVSQNAYGNNGAPGLAMPTEDTSVFVSVRVKLLAACLSGLSLRCSRLLR